MGRQAKPWYCTQTDRWMVYLDGQKISLAKGKGNKVEAKERFLQLELERSLNPDPQSRDATVASIVEAYLDFAKPNLSERTRYERTAILQSFCEAHGFRKIRECLPFHLTKWLRSQTTWKSDWTIHGAINAIQRPFNWAVQQGLIPKNPFKGITHPPGEPRRPLTPAEFQALLRATSGRVTKRRPSPGARFRQFLIFLWYSGMRPGEVSDLTWNDIDWQSASVVLRKHKTIRTQRHPRPRIVPLHPVLIKLLLSIKKRNQPSEYIFQTDRGSKWMRSTLDQRVRRDRARGGIPADAKLYGIRHNFGTRAIVNGVDIKTLATLLGHTSTRMTEHYLHLAGQREHLAASMRLANARRSGA